MNIQTIVALAALFISAKQLEISKKRLELEEDKA